MPVTTGKLGKVRLSGEELTTLRTQCFVRDKFHCRECGRRVSPFSPEWAPNRAHMAHIEGRGSGGSDELSNVTTKCRECHIVNEHNPKSVPATNSH